MAVFTPSNKTLSPEHERVYALFEIWYTVVDLAAALLFVVGSVLFFWDETQFTATWMFVIGSDLLRLEADDPADARDQVSAHGQS